MMSAREKERQNAARNRRELIAAGFSRRDFVKMGLVTRAGWLVPMRGLSARSLRSDGEEDGQPTSPPTTPFVEELSMMPIKQPVTSPLTPAPTQAPNHTGGEGRTRSHQAFLTSPPQKYYMVEQKEAFVSISPNLDLQRIWGFDGISPGPTYVARYGEPVLVRNVNKLPPKELNGGFGLPSVSTHLHNNHGPSESDGNPCDFFGPFEKLDDPRRGDFYDQHYPNVLAGIYSTHQATQGDINESLSTLWYHDHRVDFTSQNVYKGLAGFYLLFNQFDTGDELTGFHLPSFPNFDIPLLFADKVIDPTSGQIFFDLFNLDGILGDKFLVNGKIQPRFTVSPRRYRFRLLDTGPSRFYQFHLTDPANLSAVNSFWQIANDGNLLPKPVSVSNVRISVAERMDIIIDFSKFAGKSIYLENRLEQTDGRKPNGVLPAGQGNFVLRFDVTGPAVPDNSVDPALITKFYDLPDNTAQPRVTRTFRFERGNGMWQINGQFMDCTSARFRVKQNTVEKWILQNNSGGWQHPIHIHFEEFQMLKRNGVAPPPVERGRKDVARLQFDEQIELFFRFRDFVGRYPMHCHNLVHEDHAMMLLWEIDDTGDLNTRP